MRKLTLILTGILLFALPATILADQRGGIVAHVSGTVESDSPPALGGTCPSTGCVGDLVTCGAGEVMITAKLTHLFIKGICDDAGTPLCDGRLTTVDEECLDPGRDIRTVGAIVSNTSRGQFRFCFDDTPPSDCTGSPTELTIIGQGISRAQVRQILNAPNVPDGGNVELDLTTMTEFTIDGETRELEFDVIVGDFTLEPDTNMNNCGETGCGVAATFVSSDDDSSNDD